MEELSTIFEVQQLAKGCQKKKSSFKSGMGLPHSNAEPVGFLD